MARRPVGGHSEAAVEEEEADEGAVVSGSTRLVLMILSTYGASWEPRILVRTFSSESESEGGNEPGPDEDLALSDDVESASEDDEQNNEAKPYMALLQSFSESSAPKAKRRKLNDGEKESRVEEPDLAESEIEGPKDVDYAEADGGDERDGAADGISEMPLDDDEEDMSDPFDSHFANPDNASTSKKVTAVQGNRWTTKRSVTKCSRVLSMSPAGAEENPSTTAGQVTGLDSLKLKQRLRPSASSVLSGFDDAQRDLAPVLFDYKDVFYCQRTVQNSVGLRKLTCLHALNHVFK